MTGIGGLAAKEAAATPSTACSLPPGIPPSADDGLAGRTRLSKAFDLLVVAPRRRLLRSQPSARDGVWINTAQPPDDPESSWPSTIFNPFARESEEMVVPTGPPPADPTELPETDGAYGCAQPGGYRRLLAGRRHGRHAAPPAGIAGLLARKLAANR